MFIYISERGTRRVKKKKKKKKIRPVRSPAMRSKPNNNKRCPGIGHFTNQARSVSFFSTLNIVYCCLKKKINKIKLVDNRACG